MRDNGRDSLFTTRIPDNMYVSVNSPSRIKIKARLLTRLKRKHWKLQRSRDMARKTCVVALNFL